MSVSACTEQNWDRFLWEYALRLTGVRDDAQAWAETTARELAEAGDQLGARRLMVIAGHVEAIQRSTRAMN